MQDRSCQRAKYIFICMNKYMGRYINSGENQPKSQGYKFHPEPPVSGILITPQPQDPERPLVHIRWTNKRLSRKFVTGTLERENSWVTGGRVFHESAVWKTSWGGGKDMMLQVSGATQVHIWDYAAAEEMERKWEIRGLQDGRTLAVGGAWELEWVESDLAFDQGDAWRTGTATVILHNDGQTLACGVYGSAVSSADMTQSRQLMYVPEKEAEEWQACAQESSHRVCQNTSRWCALVSWLEESDR